MAALISSAGAGGLILQRQSIAWFRYYCPWQRLWALTADQPAACFFYLAMAQSRLQMICTAANLSLCLDLRCFSMVYVRDAD